MKSTGVCPKCQGREIVHLAYLLDAGEFSGQQFEPVTARTGQAYVPRALAMADETVTKTIRVPLLGERTVTIPGGTRITTEAYVCASCGLVEEYVVNPEGVPWDKVRGARFHTA